MIVNRLDSSSFPLLPNVTDAAPGSSSDWVYNAAGIPFSYTVELRDKRYYGFLAPEGEIRKSADEIFAALKVIANHIA